MSKRSFNKLISLFTRPYQYCPQCSYSWQPRGRSFSLKCPNCGCRIQEEKERQEQERLYAERARQPQPQSQQTSCLPYLILIFSLSMIFMCGCCGLLGFLGEKIENIEKKNIEKKNISKIKFESPKELPKIDRIELDKKNVVLTPMVKSELPKIDRAKYELRLWRSGEFTCQATFVSYFNEVVTIKKDGGKEIKINLNILSLEDQQYVNKIRGHK